MSEVHGMAQRGGSVVTQVRFGPQVYAPLITPGEVDCLVAFEELEAWRWLPWLREGGRLLVNRLQIHPLPVAIGQAQYPEELESQLSRLPGYLGIDANGLARQTGTTRTANMVLLGALIAGLEQGLEYWQDVVAQVVPARYREANRRALQLGYELVEN
ncbi:MAG: indolepyruvate oxidoreductase subunit beta, partial [Limnochordia bacterium]|jgi:indolepyruvate ferredoxin oxidoreductase beta subunit